MGVANAAHKWEGGTPEDLNSGGCHPGPGGSLPEITGRGAGRSGHCCPHLEARGRTEQELQTGHAVYVRQGKSVPRCLGGCPSHERSAAKPPEAVPPLPGCSPYSSEACLTPP